MPKKRIYKVVFHNQGRIYEVHASHVGQGELYGFVEVADLIFGERTNLVVDPSEEKLKTEFDGVKRFFIPMHAVIRVDEVQRQGVNKIVPVKQSGSNVTPFPVPVYTPSGDSGSS